ncbi:nuclear transport factor 2 family protein [Catalinimonas sp. 4WD22]|uniref:nuclear transport factor 2 family protein n=1 Tax=Catalinimonas locisalis TaxID=3133978 RepID=UPI0031012124
MDTPDNNLALIRKAYEAFGHGDIPTVVNMMTENIVFQVAEGGPYGGTYHGHDEVLNSIFMRLGSEWEGFKVKPEELIDKGEVVIALGEYSGIYRATGKLLKSPFVHVWRIKNGKIYQYRQYTDTAIFQQAVEGPQKHDIASQM